jgi:hypothetical protein
MGMLCLFLPAQFNSIAGNKLTSKIVKILDFFSKIIIKIK